MSTTAALVDQLLIGLTIGVVYVLLAAGLSIIFGVMDVINFAHGELYALGAYFALAVMAATGPWGFWVALIAAPVAVGVVGAMMERFTIRPLYGRNPLYHILLTFGLVLIFKDVIEIVWGPGRNSYPALPSVLTGPLTAGGFNFPKFNLFVIVAGSLLAAGTWFALNNTRFGLVVRAGAQDRGMVRHLGIDIDRYYTVVFAFGAALAAVAGVVLAGRTGLSPSMGDSVIIPAFVIVVLGGLGSFRGAVVGGLTVGVIQTLLQTPTFLEVLWSIPVLGGLVPDLTVLGGDIVVFLLMIVVLLVRPQGLFGNPEWQSSGEEGELLTGSGRGVLGRTWRVRLGALLVAVFALLPFLVGTYLDSYQVNTLVVHAMIWALFALSLDFVMGYAGLVSLGHVLFYGIGGYLAVLISTGQILEGMETLPFVGPSLADAFGMVFPTESIVIALGLGVLVAAAIAWVVGYLSIRVAGVYFAMITLAFAELFRAATNKLDWTGSDDGLVGYDFVYGVGDVNLDGLFGTSELGRVVLIDRTVVGNFVVIGGEVRLYYFFVLVLVVGSYLLARQIMNAPFGSVLQSIREGEQRSKFLGYDTTAYKRRAFVVSGALAGLAGGLQAAANPVIDPSFFHWIKSGEIIVATMLGGMGTLYGPMIGAGVFVGAEEVLGQYTEFWQGILGVLFVGFVIFVPRGLVSVPALLSERLERSPPGPGPTTATDEPAASAEGDD